MQDGVCGEEKLAGRAISGETGLTRGSNTHRDADADLSMLPSDARIPLSPPPLDVLQEYPDVYSPRRSSDTSTYREIIQVRSEQRAAREKRGFQKAAKRRAHVNSKRAAQRQRKTLARDPPAPRPKGTETHCHALT